jgi:UDP-glucuronate decarboxylase
MALAETKSSSPIIMQPLPQDDPRQRKPEISLANQHRRWVPTASLQDGLKPTTAYFRDLNRNINS